MKKSMLILLIPFLILFIVSCEGEGEDVDETPPVVSILSPTANSTVSGTINIQVSASDNNVLEKVELYTSNGLIGTSTTNDPVHSFDWDTDAAGDKDQCKIGGIIMKEGEVPQAFSWTFKFPISF